MSDLRCFGGTRYAVVRELGRGGQKVVYLVKDSVLDRECALSLIEEAMDAEAFARLRREAQSLARMGTHPNVVTVYDMGEDAGHPYVVSEFVVGGDLAGELVRAGGPLPVSRALAVVQDILRALTFIHDHGLVHRDLKPSNVWIANDGVAKLGDFGLALTPDRSRLTLSNTVTGTPGYVSPEQLENGPLDGRSDLYSLGCLMFELLAGRPPFLGTVVSVISQHLHAAPPSPARLNPEVPPELDALVLSLLQKSPEGRPSSARAALEQLRGTPVHQPSQPLLVSARATLPKRPRRLTWIALAASAAVLATIGAFALRPQPIVARRVAILPTRDVGMTVNSTIAWGLASRLVEVVDRYREFRPISHAGTLSARLEVLGRTDAVPDEAVAQTIATCVSADTVAALSIADAGNGEISVAIHVFSTDDATSGVSTVRERLSMIDLDADGPAKLGRLLTQALSRQWGTKRLTDEAEGMEAPEIPFDAFQTYLHASEFCVVGRYDQCERMVQVALERDPENALFHSLMACALSYQDGRDGEAELHAKKAIARLDHVVSRTQRNHVEGEILWFEAERARKAGDLTTMRVKAERMLALYRELDESMDPWGDLYSGAVLQYFLQDVPAARAKYAHARQKGPQFYPPYREDAVLVRGDGLSEEGNREAAKLLWSFIACNSSSDLASVARAQVTEWKLERPADLMPCLQVVRR